MMLFRLPRALLTPVSQLFLQAKPSRGGLGLSPQEFGLVNGTVGVIGLLAGGIVGGLLASRDGLKKWLWPMTFAITIPNIAYVYLAYFMPQSLMAINIAVFVENLGYGFDLRPICSSSSISVRRTQDKPLCAVHRIYGPEHDDSGTLRRGLGSDGGLQSVLHHSDGKLRTAVRCVEIPQD